MISRSTAGVSVRKSVPLLAVLVLRSGTVVTPSELADAVWGDDPPSTWPKQVQAFVVQIRRTLGSTAIATARAGYRLRVDPDAIDAVRYEHLIDIARIHRTNGDVGNVVVDPYALLRTRTVSGLFSPDGIELAANIPAGIALWDLRPSSQAEGGLAHGRTGPHRR